jgi:hypothetical protein
MDALLTFWDAHDVKWMSRKGEETPFQSFSFSSEAMRELVDPELGLTFSSGKFDTKTVIKATAGYNSKWTDEESTVIYGPTKNGSLKTESEESKDVSFTQPESTGTDKSLPGPSRSTETVQKTAEASSGIFESLLQEVEKIGRSKNLGLKIFCNVPFQESEMAMYIALEKKETKDQPWFSQELESAGSMPMIIVEKQSIISLDICQKLDDIPKHFDKLEAAKKIISDLLQTAFEKALPDGAFVKALFLSEDVFKTSSDLKIDFYIHEAKERNVQLLEGNGSKKLNKFFQKTSRYIFLAEFLLDPFAFLRTDTRFLQSMHAAERLQIDPTEFLQNVIAAIISLYFLSDPRMAEMVRMKKQEAKLSKKMEELFGNTFVTFIILSFFLSVCLSVCLSVLYFKLAVMPVVAQHLC